MWCVAAAAAVEVVRVARWRGGSGGDDDVVVMVDSCRCVGRRWWRGEAAGGRIKWLVVSRKSVAAQKN
ncbi:hypothetical protein Tco_0645567 [Tanacetum coccineum]